jgi:hypothetical protein
VTLRNSTLGWPMVMARLKSLLENGHPLEVDSRSKAEREPMTRQRWNSAN